MTTSVAAPRLGSSIPAPDSLADRFYDLLALPTPRLDAEMARVLQSEHEFPDPLRYEATLARLRAWLALDPEDVRILVAACDRATATFPPEYRWRRMEAERAVMLNALTFPEFRRLADLLPWVAEEAVATLAGVGGTR